MENLVGMEGEGWKMGGVGVGGGLMKFRSNTTVYIAQRISGVAKSPKATAIKVHKLNCKGTID